MYLKSLFPIGVVLVFLLVFQNCSGFDGVGSFTTPSLGVDDSLSDDKSMEDIDEDLSQVALKYFPSGESEVAEKRLARLTHNQIDLTVKTLFPGMNIPSISQTMPADPRRTNYEFVESLRVDNANFTPFIGWVEQIAEQVKASPNTIIDCRASQDKNKCYQDGAVDFINKATRNSASSTQVQAYIQLFMAQINDVGEAEAKAALVDVVLNSPHFLFRSEFSTGGQDILTSSDLMQTLSYTLADVPPAAFELPVNNIDEQALKTASDKLIKSNEGKEKLIRFFKYWLEIKSPESLESSYGPTFNNFDSELSQAMVNETDKFLRQRLYQIAPKLKDVTESTESYVDTTLNEIYGNSTTSDTELVKLNPLQRVGIFTQPALIASHSAPEVPGVVKRGAFFARKVMCLRVGEIPPGQGEIPAAEPNESERQRIERVTSGASCMACHRYLNPFGFMYESFNSIGQWRTTDEKGLAVDTSMNIDFLDSGTFMGQQPVESIKYVTKSHQFKQCFVRQMFRFYMGRMETPSDDPVLRKMYFNFALNNEQNILNALDVLSNSSRFYRRVAGN